MGMTPGSVDLAFLSAAITAQIRNPATGGGLTVQNVTSTGTLPASGSQIYLAAVTGNSYWASWATYSGDLDAMIVAWATAAGVTTGDAYVQFAFQPGAPAIGPSSSGLALTLARCRIPTALDGMVSAMGIPQCGAIWPTPGPVGSTAAPYSGHAPLSAALLATALQQVSIIATSATTGATSDATAIVTYIQANAVAVISGQSCGVIPGSTTPGTPIDPPGSPVNLSIN